MTKCTVPEFTILNTKQVVSGILNLSKFKCILDIANKEQYEVFSIPSKKKICVLPMWFDLNNSCL